MEKQQHFSARTAWETSETELARALRERKESGLPVIDLTASNPTACGFSYDDEGILSALAIPGALAYEPIPQGMLHARQSVCDYYRDHGAPVTPEQIVLTTSTSEAYSYLFRLLCDPGDEVLMAQPSYPLFDFLAALDDVKLVPFALFYDYGWHVDLEDLRRRITSRTRAILLVHPNNPTGHFTSRQERLALESLCVEHGLALIVDEVFLDYGIGEHIGESFAAAPHPVLTFVLSGLSKIAGLPQMKAAWIAAFGPEAVLREAQARLEIIADTFLSMNAPVQFALPQWLAGRADIQRQILERVTGNLEQLDRMLSAQALVTRLALDGGWYAILRVPALQSDAETALYLLQKRGISVHPGYFFGFPAAGWLVVSLLTEQEPFREGIDSILFVCNELAART